MNFKPRVAIIGAGLAGLSAAYHLSKFCPSALITVYEASENAGGRVLTRTSKPRGEHGAEYLLGSELSGEKEYRLSAHGGNKKIKDLFAELKVELDAKSKIPSPACFWNSRYYPSLRFNAFLDRKTATQISKLFREAKKEAFHHKGMFRSWLNSKFSLSSAGIAFVNMLLAGETCAPSTSLSTSYALGCLNSAISETESWYRIKSGSQALVAAFTKKLEPKNVHFYYGKPVSRIICSQARPKVQTEGRLPRRFFDAVLITTPDGERLNGKKTIEFHSYISVLIPCEGKPRVRSHRSQWLGGAVYLDSPLNFVQFGLKHYTLRVLLPIADPMVRDSWSDETIVSFCKYFLDPMVQNGCLDYKRCSVQRWEFGLPCPGREHFRDQCTQHAGGIFFAGDRFSKWPSMAGAIVSGSRAAEKIAGFLQEK